MHFMLKGRKILFLARGLTYMNLLYQFKVDSREKLALRSGLSISLTRCISSSRFDWLFMHCIS